MRIAIVHDWLVVNAGAEKVLKSIYELYPTADLFSLVDFLSLKDKKDIFDDEKKIINTSFIQSFPNSKKYFRYYLPLFPKAIESFDLSSYDLIISSSWAVAKGIKKIKNQKHICYCHTPIRYAWDLYDEYTNSLKQPKKFFVELTLKYIRNWDIRTLDRVNYFIANSNFVKDRIKKTYDLDSVVIYPPVDTDIFTLKESKEDYYLTASRLVPYKKTKLIVEAFNAMPNKKLIVIGDGEEFDTIRKIASNNITVLGYQSQHNLVNYMKNAKAFLYAAIEDFGIVPIEAMSCGTPVIALNEGGTKETVKNLKTGLHFKRQNISDIIRSVNDFEKLKFDYKNISLYANEFNDTRFKNEFTNFIKGCLD